MTIEEIKDTLQTWIRTADDEYDREEMGRVQGLKEALHLIKKLDVPDTNVGELISREEVLNLIDTAFESGAFDGRYAYENLIDAVQNLPSAQPEQNCVLTMFGDCSYVETGCSDCQIKAKITKTFELFGNPEKRTEERTETHACDCISREDLKQKFQWLAKATKYGNKDAEQQNFSYSTMMMYEIADMIEDAIDSCSSVEPERKTGKWIERTCGVGAHCDQCGKFCQIQFTADRKYCPNCGSRMEVDNGQS